MAINIPFNAFTMMDRAFGTSIADTCVSKGWMIDPEKSITASEKYSLAIRYPEIVDKDFRMINLVSDMEKLADAFGMNQSAIKFSGIDDAETFTLCLNFIDLLLGALIMLPFNSKDIRDKVKEVAKTISKYIPKIEDLGKLLAQAPGLVKYADVFAYFGENVDKAIILLDSNGDWKDAIRIIKEAIHKVLEIDVNEILDMAQKNSVKVTGALEGEVVDIHTTTNIKGKKGGKKMSTDDTVAVVAMQQQPLNLEQTFLDTNLYLEHDSGYIPEFMLEMPVVNKTTGNNFPSPVEQFTPNQEWRGVVPFVDQIQAIANGNGLYMQTIPIFTPTGVLALVKFNTYANMNGVCGAYIYSKSFVVDLGVIIDGRRAIWPCSSIFDEQAYYPVEYCSAGEAYYLFTKDGKLNSQFIDSVLKYGFNGLDKKILSSNVIHSNRMVITNQKIDLINTPNGYLNNEQRSIIRGACCRMATKLDPKFGRYSFESLDPKTLTFILTNVNVPDYFLGGISPRPISRKLCRPQLDKDGNHILVNQKGGSDIRYVVEDV